jgi:hypothetical protein
MGIIRVELARKDEGNGLGLLIALQGDSVVIVHLRTP